jgi:hypothetical protein
MLSMHPHSGACWTAGYSTQPQVWALIVLGTPGGQHLRTTESTTRQNERNLSAWYLLQPLRCCAARSLAVFYDAAGVRGLSVLPRPLSAIS